MRARRHRERAGVDPQTAREVKHMSGQIERAVVDEAASIDLPTTPLSPLAMQLLVATQSRTGKRRADILDVLLREHAVRLK
jgi:hypothetical protein